MDLKNNMTIGQRIGLTAAFILVLLIMSGAVTWFTVNNIEAKSQAYAQGVQQNEAANRLEIDIYELVVEGNRYLATYNEEDKANFEAKIASLNEYFSVHTNPNEGDDLGRLNVSIHELFQDYVESFRAAFADIEANEKLKQQEILPRLDRLKEILEKHLAAAQSQGDIASSFSIATALQLYADSKASINEYLLEQTQAGEVKVKTTLKSLRESTGELLSQMEEMRSFDASLVDEIQLSETQELVRISEELPSLFESLEERVGQIEHLSQKDLANFFPEVTALHEEFSKKLNNRQRENLNNVQRTQKNAQMLTMIISLVAIVFGGAISFYMIRVISRQIRGVAAELNENVTGTFRASEQVAESSQALADGSGQQAAALQETNASLETMTTKTQSNAENATNAKEIAGLTRGAAEAGSTQMENMSAAMSDIKQSSDNIAAIIKTIDEIAFQTNLLALNAAVEAARAGEAGAGFAVVADEVRNLSHRAAEAAKETTEKIEDSLSKSENGVAICAKVGEHLEDILNHARKVDQLVDAISESSTEQNDGIGQIGRAVSELDQLTQRNAATAEETSSASRLLNEQASNLQNTVDVLLRMAISKREAGEFEKSVSRQTQNESHDEESGKSAHGFSMSSEPEEFRLTSKITGSNGNGRY